jgi:hypothetical protein
LPVEQKQAFNNRQRSLPAPPFAEPVFNWNVIMTNDKFGNNVKN